MHSRAQCVRGVSLLFVALLVAVPVLASDALRVLDKGKKPNDARLEKPRALGDKYHPWTPPKKLADWEKDAEQIRRQVLVANGLWPMPPVVPLKPVVHGKIERDGYTVEKVFFASHPGHYVTGNLYKPKSIQGKVPGVLCPHGHWANGRFYDAGEEEAKKLIAGGGESNDAAARYHIQARMAGLAKLGCVVFHYDMVGYADSRQIKHSQGFADAAAGLRLQSFMGLQTFNSLRALDFLLSLPEVDPQRIGVTGASGGGTQTFVLCAIDPRPTVAFPAVMVSTDMQGGCICENADYLRIGINNVALAALCAPRPMAMSGANDWTVNIETNGLPELKQVYALYGKADLVHAKAFPQFGHNYNRVSREMMYEWFNRHLQLGQTGTIAEQPLEPVPPAELSVFDAEHPVPADAKSSEQLREYLTDVSDRQFAELIPKSKNQVAEYTRVVGGAARVMLGGSVPQRDDIQIDVTRGDDAPFGPKIRVLKGLIFRSGVKEQIPWVLLAAQDAGGRTVIWIDGRGKNHILGADGQPKPAVRKLLERGYAVVSADVFLTGEFLDEGQPAKLSDVDKKFDGYTFCYNRPVIANRVRDILMLIGGTVHFGNASDIRLVGTGEAAPWVLLAAGVADGNVTQAIVDVNGFCFAKVAATDDPMYLPGALKYGGLGGLAALASPAKLTIAGVNDAVEKELQPLKAVYSATESKIDVRKGPLDDEGIANAILE